MKTYDATVTCKTCGAVLNTAIGVPENEKSRIVISAPIMCLCKERGHNTGSDYNLNFNIEWKEHETENQIVP